MVKHPVYDIGDIVYRERIEYGKWKDEFLLVEERYPQDSSMPLFYLCLSLDTGEHIVADLFQTENQRTKKMG